jgi:Ni/Co efflux regulator RcnB
MTVKLDRRAAMRRLAFAMTVAVALGGPAMSLAEGDEHHGGGGEHHGGEGGGEHHGGGEGWSRGGGAAPGGPDWSHGGPGGGPNWSRGGREPGWGHAAPEPWVRGPSGWSRAPRHGEAPSPVPGGPRPGGWDTHRYNGYWASGRWYFGQPEAPAYRSPGFRPGFTPWRRGSYLPPEYQSFDLDEYWRYHLRRPPLGYHWVQVGDEFLLVSVSTGLIFDVVTGG